MTCKDCEWFVRAKGHMGMHADGICIYDEDNPDRSENDPVCYAYKRGDDTFYNRVIAEKIKNKGERK